MTYQITNPDFANYTGPLGKTNWVDGKTDSIPDRMDVDMVRLTMGLEQVEDETNQPTE